MVAENSTLSVDVMRTAAAEATATLFALANQNRLLLLCQLCNGEMSVSALEEALGIHQPTLSQQLGVLRSEGLIASRREGKRIYYSVANPKVLVLINTLVDLYCPQKRDLP
ncbi:transcriptional regulator [Rhodospirillum rubrum]|uniref:ArsR/SmtB family transcription factor n=1 Tax=Rhodospirillum rubrum TaxID=1085 RepID=UPI001903089D|nr:metalloregulator ArsR/SmtB family transcription factor [Rhodospirillum rubrum]MBK1665293.1 transcriptional regulator [Rhodospirillum rubrum]MBK1677162.1 transcriptional regulator [Rhodospirillum rubrum]